MKIRVVLVGSAEELEGWTSTHQRKTQDIATYSRLIRKRIRVIVDSPGGVWQDSKIEERMSRPRSRPEVLSLVELNPRDSSTRNDGAGGGYVYSNSVSVWFGFVCLFHFWDIRWMCMVDGRIRWVCMHYGGRLDFDMMHGGF